MGKVLFFDIDGTLVNADGVVPASAKKALEQARMAGHRLVICSGRSGHQIPQWIYDYFDGLVNCTGARVICKGRIICEHFVPREDVKRAREALDAAHGVLVGQTEECTILSKEGYDYLYDFMVRSGRPRERIENMLGNAILTPTMEECGKIKKFFYHRSDKTIGELEKELGDIFTIEAASFRKDREDCGEICCKGINKSYGMEKYLEYVGLTRKDAIAFGDGPNDLDMHSFAETGVAMGNGLEEVKKLADFVTKDIDENGIAYALKELGLIKLIFL